MGDRSAISWTDATWNPVRGCSRVSEGCRHCYAETVAGRFCGPGQAYEGLAERRLKVISEDEGRLEGRWTGAVRMVPEHLADPIRWRRPRRVFVNSMSDLFHEKLTDENIAAVFGVMAAAPHHTFQVLTKRPARMRAWFDWLRESVLEDESDYASTLADHAAEELCDGSAEDHSDQYDKIVELIRNGWAREGADGGTTLDQSWPLPNVQLGVSVEHQAAADERIPLLLKTPAALRFLSCEPLLGPVRLDDGLTSWLRTGLGWVIAGCESGFGARAAEVAWFRGLRDQCRRDGKPFFLKQAVELTVSGGRVYPSSHAARRPDVAIVAAGEGSKVKARGVVELPYLDGVQHAAFPEVADRG